MVNIFFGVNVRGVRTLFLFVFGCFGVLFGQSDNTRNNSRPISSKTYFYKGENYAAEYFDTQGRLVFSWQKRADKILKINSLYIHSLHSGSIYGSPNISIWEYPEPNVTRQITLNCTVGKDQNIKCDFKNNNHHGYSVSTVQLEENKRVITQGSIKIANQKPTFKLAELRKLVFEETVYTVDTVNENRLDSISVKRPIELDNNTNILSFRPDTLQKSFTYWSKTFTQKILTNSDSVSVERTPDSTVISHNVMARSTLHDKEVKFKVIEILNSDKRHVHTESYLLKDYKPEKFEYYLSQKTKFEYFDPYLEKITTSYYNIRGKPVKNILVEIRKKYQ